MHIDYNGLDLLIIIPSVTFGLLLVISLVFLFTEGITDYKYDGYKKTLVLSSLGTAISVFGLVIFILVGSLKMSERRNEHYDRFEYNIVSLERAAGIEGHSTLGTGSISDKQYYIVYHETQYGYMQAKFGVESTYIREESANNPRVHRWKEAGSEYYYFTIYVPNGYVDTYIATF